MCYKQACIVHSVGNLLSSVLLIFALVASQVLTVNITPERHGQGILLYSAYVNMYFASFLDFAQGLNVKNEIQFDSMNK